MLNKLTSAFVVLGVSLAAPAQAATLQTSNLFELPTRTPIVDSVATLNRTSNSLDLNINTSNLDPGAYSVWWLIFNNPEFCVEGCGVDDFANPDVQASVIWATGDVVDASEIGDFSASLTENYLPDNPQQLLFGNGLLDSFAAEIQSVVRYHGPASDEPDLLEQQLTTFNGQCSLTAGDGLFPCSDSQITQFEGVKVPEPSSVLGFMGLGIFGLVFRKKTLG
ncbi:MAG: PEP-CTERM sorting domain-containing protein [Limnoraphis robusta]|uniref:Ice-binding protein C-terminal domain-containing protein n=1 Tax=Limnoraphis robusta CS-951 TaxID=1637645 RepID=A0A0F5YM35_9CYAN|nr:PEP-CTERM sorting domain-containing protein [Limnoraphis robusta]KKD39702.1 hypothetical protein WN50_01840 [Limnoraphis robusta CS-951]